MNRKYLLTLLWLPVVAVMCTEEPAAVGAEAKDITSSVKQVVLYRGQALITREVAFEADKGQRRSGGGRPAGKRVGRQPVRRRQ